MTQSLPKIGFIGLGIMGAPMCGHLIAAGYQLFVHTKGKMPAFVNETRATQCVNARGVAERADIIVENPITLKIKAVAALFPAHESQLLTYLRTSQLRIGLLMNFHARRLKDGVRRFIV